MYSWASAQELMVSIEWLLRLEWTGGAGSVRSRIRCEVCIVRDLEHGGAFEVQEHQVGIRGQEETRGRKEGYKKTMRGGGQLQDS